MLIVKNEDEVRKGLSHIIYRLGHIYFCDHYLNTKKKLNKYPEKIFLPNACLISYLTFVRVNDEFFWKPQTKNIRKSDFLATDCLTKDEYNNLYKLLVDNGYILDEHERKNINQLIVHSTIKENINLNWYKSNFTDRTFKAFREFLKYQRPRKLIELQNYISDSFYKNVINLLE